MNRDDAEREEERNIRRSEDKNDVKNKKRILICERHDGNSENIGKKLNKTNIF